MLRPSACDGCHIPHKAMNTEGMSTMGRPLIHNRKMKKNQIFILAPLQWKSCIEIRNQMRVQNWCLCAMINGTVPLPLCCTPPSPTRAHRSPARQTHRSESFYFRLNVFTCEEMQLKQQQNFAPSNINSKQFMIRWTVNSNMRTRRKKIWKEKW